MTEKIMQDNIMYLQEWMRYNPSLKENLTIDGSFLYCKMNEELQKIDISHFYLPDMLYNENFRASITLEEEITGFDLFRIIKLYIEGKEIMDKEQKELQKYPKIINIQIKKDENNIEFIEIIDEFQKKYRYDTKNPEQIINLFNELKKKQETITLKELGSVIQNDNKK